MKSDGKYDEDAFPDARLQLRNIFLLKDTPLRKRPLTGKYNRADKKS